MWHVHGKCRMALAGDEWPQWVWNCFIGCVYDSLGEACRQWVTLWVWYVLSGGGTFPMGVSVASVGVFMA